MTKFYDGKKVLSISMVSLHDPEGVDFSADFFTDGINSGNYNADLDAYKVDDVDYIIDYAESYANGTNTDFDYTYDSNGNRVEDCRVDYDVEAM